MNLTARHAFALLLALPAAAAAAPVFGDLSAHAAGSLGTGGSVPADTFSYRQELNQGPGFRATAYLQSPEDAPQAARFSTTWEAALRADRLDVRFDAAAIHRGDTTGLRAATDARAVLRLFLDAPTAVALTGSGWTYGISTGDVLSASLRVLDADGREALGATLTHADAFTAISRAATLAPGRYTVLASVTFDERFAPTPQPDAAYTRFTMTVPSAGTLAALGAGLILVAGTRRRG